MFPKALFVLTAVALAVNAQSSTISPPAPSASSVPLSPCALQCLTPAAAQNGCTSITDVTCVCTNLQFQADAGACLREHCTDADVQAAGGLQQQFCSGITPSSTVLPTPRPVSFTSVSAISTPPVVSSSTIKPSGSSTSPKPSSTPGSGGGSSSGTSAATASTNLQAGAVAFFGAILAAVFAL